MVSNNVVFKPVFNSLDFSCAICWEYINIISYYRLVWLLVAFLVMLYTTVVPILGEKQEVNIFVADEVPKCCQCSSMCHVLQQSSWGSNHKSNKTHFPTLTSFSFQGRKFFKELQSTNRLPNEIVCLLPDKPKQKQSNLQNADWCNLMLEQR